MIRLLFFAWWMTMPILETTHWKDRIVYPGEPGRGKQIVLISGDEEYRSEEALPCLGRILSAHHGFTCTILFAMSGDRVDPNNRHNIPGLEVLEGADLLVIATRFRDLPDDQMEHIDRYLRRGGPVIGLRTATHAFQIPSSRRFSHYGNGYRGELEEWEGGFGRLVLGEQWISHHGDHGRQATRGVIPDEAKDDPIVRGCEDIFALSDVYKVRVPLPGNSRPLVHGAVLESMEPNAKPVTGEKNHPMMPVAWTRTYQIGTGKVGRVFTTTLGASVDLESEGLRRLLVNAAYWCLGLEDRIPTRARVDIPGEFKPSFYGFKEDAYWKQRSLRPKDLR